MFSKVGSWVANLSAGKLLFLAVFVLVGLDMVCYYIAAFIGRSTPPYPMLYDIFSLLRDIHLASPTGGSGA